MALDPHTAGRRLPLLSLNDFKGAAVLLEVLKRWRQKIIDASLVRAVMKVLFGHSSGYFGTLIGAPRVKGG